MQHFLFSTATRSLVNLTVKALVDNHSTTPITRKSEYYTFSKQLHPSAFERLTFYQLSQLSGIS